MNAKFNFNIPTEILDRVKAIAEERKTTATAIFNQLAIDFIEGENRIEALEKRVSEIEKEIERLKHKK